MKSRPATYMMSGASLREAQAGVLEVVPSMPAWITPIVSGGLFLFLGIFLLLGGQDNILFGMMGLALAVSMLAAYPISIKMTFDFVNQSSSFSANYLLRFPRHIEMQASLSQIAKAGFRPTLFNKKQWVEIMLTDGNRFTLEFGRRTTEAERLLARLHELTEASVAPNLNMPDAVQGAEIAGVQALMARELRSWSVMLLILGVAQMFAAGGFSPWGLLLIGVGLASFYFREAPMFIVYATTIAWAGVSNLLYGSATWKGFAVVQAILAFQIYRQFQRFQRAESAAIAASDNQAGRTAKIFPWLSLTLGGGALIGFCIVLLGIAVSVLALHSQTLTIILGWMESVAVYAGILGLATGLASWLSAHPHKFAWMIGTISGGLTLIAEIAIGLLT